MKITIPKAIKFLAACLFMLLPAACINESEDNQSKSGTVKVGDKLPDFRVTMSTGEALRTNDLKGKPALHAPTAARSWPPYSSFTRATAQAGR